MQGSSRQQQQPTPAQQGSTLPEDAWEGREDRENGEELGPRVRIMCRQYTACVAHTFFRRQQAAPAALLGKQAVEHVSLLAANPGLSMPSNQPRHRVASSAEVPARRPTWDATRCQGECTGCALRLPITISNNPLAQARQHYGLHTAPDSGCWRCTGRYCFVLGSTTGPGARHGGFCLPAPASRAPALPLPPQWRHLCMRLLKNAG